MTKSKQMRAYRSDPLGFLLDLMKQRGETGGGEAFLKFLAENDPDRIKQVPGLVKIAIDVFRGDGDYDPTSVISPPPKRQQ